MALKVKIGADGSQFMREMDKVDKRGKSMGDKMKAAGKAAGLGIAAIGAAAVASAVAVGALAVKMIDIGAEANASDARVRNIVKSMGLFGQQSDIVAEKLNQVADKIELQTGLDGAAIQMTQAKLATFKELAKTADVMGGAFDRATMAAVDMAAAGFGSAEQNAVQLGKALNDPIKGINSLTRSGITFTQAEKDKIKTLVESNQMLKAQQIILSAIETQVGGTAASTAKGMDRIKAAFNIVIGEAAMPLAASFDTVANKIAEMAPKIQEAMANLAPKIRAVADTIGNAISEAISGDMTRLVGIASLVGESIGKAIAAGVKYGLRSLGENITGAVNFHNDPMVKKIFESQGIENNLQSQGSAASELFKRDMQDLAEAAAAAARALQAMPIAGTVDGVGGSKFRYAKEGENSSFRDSSGRMLVLLENIARNTSAPTFANP